MTYDPIWYLLHGEMPVGREDVQAALRLVAEKLTRLARHAAASGHTPVITLRAEEAPGADPGYLVAAGLDDGSPVAGTARDLEREAFYLLLAFRGRRCEQVAGPFATREEVIAHTRTLSRLSDIHWRLEADGLWSAELVNHDDSRMTYQILRMR